MPDFLLELLSEEIPARMQQRAGEDLKKLVSDGLADAGLNYGTVRAYTGPRRLALNVEGLSAKAQDTAEERKGPRVDAPAQAVEGFLKSTGLTRDQLSVQDDKKGAFYLARIERPGRSAREVIAELVPDVVRKFPWPKSMRWGSGKLRWVRPLKSIVAMLEGEVVPFEIDGIRSGNKTRGHRFMGAGGIEVQGFKDYAASLAGQHVMIDAAERSAVIRSQANAAAGGQGFEVVEDEALVAEVAGLVEWPVVLMGSFDESFLDVPQEAVRATIRSNQKCFVLRQAATGKLSNRYLTVANLVASDGGNRITEGNDRVIAARLADARFFWEQDRKVRLQDRLGQLEGITFHARLGSQGQRVRRIEKLAGEIAAIIGADVEKSRQAARLAKADLVTGMVGEFPELQGVMGRYYALAEGLDEEVADAIRDHYRPQGPSDGLPQTRVAQAVALADKIDTLTGFWSIDEKPTGSKDPYALRRAALGIIRIILEGGLRLNLVEVMHPHSGRFAELLTGSEDETAAAGETLVKFRGRQVYRQAADLLDFFADRLTVYLRDKGVRHDLIDAVFALGEQDDLALIVRRVEALDDFLATEDGQSLLAGVRRATNILRIEEKNDRTSYDGEPNVALLKQGEEKALHAAMRQAVANARSAADREDFATAMAAMAKLRTPVDKFFDKVTVNAEDPSFRENRLLLLSRIRAAAQTVADFSRIEG